MASVKNNLDLPYFNSTNFPLAVKGQLSQADYTEKEAALLKYHQFVVKEYFTRTNTRGLLICHGMGQGKTRLAVAIATHVNTFDPNRQVIVLSAKSLEANFRKEIVAYTGSTNTDDFKFISLNAGNMFRKISNVDKTDEQYDLEKRLGEFMDDVVRTSALENAMLIVDEAHNLFNSITNGAKNALALYDLIMETTNLKVIFMSGTPIINDPFELVPCFNMIRGTYTDELPLEEASDDQNKRKSRGIAGRKPKTSTTLFTEDISEFEEFFVDRERKTIKNKDKFTNRIYGLSSYYGDLYFSSDTNKPGFPTKLPTIIEKVPMSQTQFARYISARILEQDETKRGYRVKDSRFSSSTGGSSTYRVKSRQISNYCIPEYALGPVRGSKSREKFIHKITTDDLQNVKEFSPKMAKILANIDKHEGQLGVVYSQFVSGEGIGIFSLILKALGWRQFGEMKSTADDYGLPDNKEKTFAVLSGSIDPEDRAKTIIEFNKINTGINLLLLSGAVAEGIDLKRGRHVHIMEPFWNYARINQVETRLIRYLSHEDLPEDQRNVQVYIYLSDYPKGYPKEKRKEETTDIDLYTKSIDNMEIINTFLLAIAESSIDCSIHYPKLDDTIKKNISCKLCAPDNKMLYHPLLRRDMELPSTCQPLDEKKVTVKEIILPDVDEKFYYKKNTDGSIRIYHFNKRLNGYAPVPRSHALYADIMSAVVLQEE
jgi:SNF2 family DNA or RNA helicase